MKFDNKKPAYIRKDFEDKFMNATALYRLKWAPFNVVTNGNLWVMIFFFLSGFVLPLRYFKTKEH